MIDPRKPIFDAIRTARGKGFDVMEVSAIDNLLDALGVDRNDIVVKPKKLSDPAAFFAEARTITGGLDQVQVDAINGILTHAQMHPLGWVAYELATGWHEARFKPQPEWGRGKGKPYGDPGAHFGQAPYGRGLVQLTHDANYEWADQRFGLNGALLKNFDKALEPDLAARILVIGMEEGAFTGKKLADYIKDRGMVDQFAAARRIVNGTDKAQNIAAIAVQFQQALELGGWA